ncbi:hypothetical protein ACJMK2_015877 [Sinanodonta woodiana]|uniref:Cysteine and tyrosine-rich protein 1 n=1 Tax=Sinanodonta woodiana TaxID=1069815 RepID=A0ABD3URT8_SINWO
MFYFIIACTLLLEAIPVETGEYCPYGYYTSVYGYSYYYSTYCDYGCCGDKYSSYSNVCCTQNLAGVIAGAVIGSLVGLAIIIGLIVFCCVSANNAKRRTGTVIQSTNPTTQAFVVSSNTVTQVPSTNPYGPVGYGYPGFGPPPAYSSFNNVPQGGTNPAYPPPPPPAANY